MENFNDENDKMSRREEKVLLAVVAAIMSVSTVAIAVDIYHEVTRRTPTEEEQQDPSFQACMTNTTKKEVELYSRDFGFEWDTGDTQRKAKRSAEDICLKVVFPRP